MWAVLHRDAAVYQASLNRALAWAQQYFVQDSPETKAFIQNLETLQKIDIQPPTIDLAETLQHFDQYLAQNGKSKAQ